MHQTGGHHLGGLPVELRSLRGKTVGTVVPQLVGQVAAGDKYRTTAQVLHCLGDALPQPVVIQRGKSGQSNAEDRAVNPGLPQKVQRHKRNVIKLRIFRARKKPTTFSQNQR